MLGPLPAGRRRLQLRRRLLQRNVLRFPRDVRRVGRVSRLNGGRAHSSAGVGYCLHRQ